MIMPSDKEYTQTKRILNGKSKMNQDFVSVANWIDSTYEVKTVNIIYDIIDHNKQPRLQICFEYEKEKLKFDGNSSFGYDAKKQTEIGEAFRKLAPSNKYEGENIWVVISAFEPVAKMEILQDVPDSEFKNLRKEIINPAVWEVQPAFSGVTVFLFTDDQVKEFETTNEKDEWTTKYFNLFKKYDKFGYLERGTFSIDLDSKENFDNNFESNWFYYYK